MEELIAKRYIKALRLAMSEKELEEMLALAKAIGELFEDKKVKLYLLSPQIKEEEKAALLLDAIQPQNPKIANFIKMVALKRRLDIFPALAKELAKELALMKREFEGCVYSNFQLNQKEIAKIASALSKRVNAKVKLRQCAKEYDGIKVEVDTVGIEVDFSRSKIKKQLIDDILKAI